MDYILCRECYLIRDGNVMYLERTSHLHGEFRDREYKVDEGRFEDYCQIQERKILCRVQGLVATVSGW